LSAEETIRVPRKALREIAEGLREVEKKLGELSK
jgi:hypothetical protein